MAFDEELEARTRLALDREGTAYEVKYMFGGVAFMVRGHMAVGIVKDDLMVRVGPEAHEDALAEPHVRPMDFAGRPMKGMVYVSPQATRGDEALARWVAAGTRFARSQPPKKKSATKKSAKKAASSKANGEAAQKSAAKKSASQKKRREEARDSLSLIPVSAS